LIVGIHILLSLKIPPAPRKNFDAASEYQFITMYEVIQDFHCKKDGPKHSFCNKKAAGTKPAA
jgi:hypothetical protein